jgi:NTP pyrophosphatase (non-canonical NTP hydrolase)
MNNTNQPIINVGGTMSVTDALRHNEEIYGLVNRRRLELHDLQTHMGRFWGRCLKNIRKEDTAMAAKNLSLALSWFFSIINDQGIALEEATWLKFPACCSYCDRGTCRCSPDRPTERKEVARDRREKPRTLAGWQRLFAKVYPARKRTLDSATSHLTEEIEEFKEAFFQNRELYTVESWLKVEEEAADVFSCIMGVANSLSIDLAKEYSASFFNGCHLCNDSPCQCSFHDLCSV